MRDTADPSSQRDGGGEAIEDHAASRRLVTVLFADVVGSTSIGERLDPERFAAIQTRMFAAVRPVIERHGGTVEKFIGDAVMAVFGYPVVREDDALRAARAALELTPAIAALDAELHRRAGIRLQLRIGLHSGEVLASGGSDALVSGDTVSIAARIQSMAEPASVLLSAGTLALLGPAVRTTVVGPVDVRGRDGTIVVHALHGVTGADARAGLDAPFVGRRPELDSLHAALLDAIGGQTRMVTLLGQAGVGKSRLVRRFVETLPTEVRVLRGRCLSYGDGTTWWALGGIVRDIVGVPAEGMAQEAAARLADLVAGIDGGDEIGEVLGAVLGVGARSASADDIGWAARRLLGAVTAERPTVVVVEDIHWAEPPLLDLLETIVDWSPDLRLLLLCPARPDLFDVRAGWGSASGTAVALPLDALDTAEAAQLLRSLPGGDAIPPSLADRILAVAEGNALYLEEFVARLRDRGDLVDADGTWSLRSAASFVDVPPTVNALVSARIDGLPSRERHVAERGAVVGRQFGRSAVTLLSSDLEPGSIGPALLGLTRRAIVMPDRGGGAGDDLVRFRHILLRDLAYARIPKAQRADLHRRFAAWLQGSTRFDGDELVPVVSHHLATAAELLISLDPLDDGLDAVLAEADAWMRRAIDRARRLHAWSEVVNLADRLRNLADSAGALGPDAWLALVLRAAEGEMLGGAYRSAADRLADALDHPHAEEPRTRARIGERLAMALRHLGDETGAFRVLDDALQGLPPDARHEAGLVLATRGRLRLILRDDAEGAAVDTERAIELGGDADDDPWYAGALVTLATVLGRRPDEMEWEVLFDRALVLAERNQDPETIVRAYGNRSVVLNRRGDVEGDIEWLERGIRRADELGVSRSPAGIGLRHNAVADALRQARLEYCGARLAELDALGVTGEPAIQLMVDRGVLAGMTGSYVEARTWLERARAAAAQAGTESMQADALGQSLALDILTGDPQALAGHLAEASRIPRGAQADIHGIVAWATAFEAADRSIDARARGDREAEAAALMELRTVAMAAARSLDEPDLDRWNRGELLLIDGELARGTDVREAERWRACITALEANTSHWHALYARYRLAEAVVHESHDPALLHRTLADAEAAARTVGAIGILERILALRDG